MDFFSDAIERLFSARSGPQQIRAIEGGGSAAPLWREIHESGFADALIGEGRGGAGLGLVDIFGVLLACGAYAVPVPLALTMLARAALAGAGQAVPEGPITIATTAVKTPDGGLACSNVTYARTSDWVLLCLDGACMLLSVRDASVTSTGIHGSLAGNLQWASRPSRLRSFASALDWQAACAGLFAVQLAGAMERVFASTLRYANERSQFGRLIGRFQAVQQQVSVMAELVAAARMAAQMGCACAGPAPDLLLAAMAKAQTSEAAVQIAATAHAVHGAIGITDEYDLQLHTRRLHEWRAAFGSETYWNRRIGETLLDDASRTSLAFVRERLFPPVA